MALDRRYLEKHGNQWRVVVKVPARLRPVIGKPHLRHPLRTDSLAIANREKFKHVAVLKAQLAQAEREQRRREKLQPDPLTEEAFEWREKIALAEDDPSFYQYVGADGKLEDAPDLAKLLLVDRAEEIERREGFARAKQFHDVATGTATPILSLVSQWLAERPMKPRQQTDYRRAVTKFEAWLSASKLPTTVEGCSRRIAGRYVSDAFVEAGVHPRTANKDISCLSSFWKWLAKKRYASDNVWREQSLAKPQPKKNEAKRPYTDQEMKALFSGRPSPLLRDTMAIAALGCGSRRLRSSRLRTLWITASTSPRPRPVPGSEWSQFTRRWPGSSREAS